MAICEPVKMSIVRGTTNAFGLSLKRKDTGESYTLATGEVLLFGLKMNLKDQASIFTKKITNAVGGEYYLELEPTDTQDLPPGQYYYDVCLQSGSTVLYSVIEPSPFLIKANVTKLGDGA